MANQTDFNIKLVTDRKDFEKLRQDLNKVAKETKKQFNQQIKAESKHNRTKRRELVYQKRLEVGRVKDRKKHLDDLQKMENKGWKAEEVHGR